jgi:hypothetical protein
MRTNSFANVKVTRVPIGIWLPSWEKEEDEATGFFRRTRKCAWMDVRKRPPTSSGGPSRAELAMGTLTTVTLGLLAVVVVLAVRETHADRRPWRRDS